MDRHECEPSSIEQDREASRRDLFKLAGGAGLAAIIIGRSAQVAAQDATPPPTGAVGISMQAMGRGEPTPAPGLELTLRRTTLAVGGRLPDHTHPGSLVIFVESGLFGYTALGGIANITRKPVDGTPVPSEAMPVGTEVVLEPGDWIYSEDPRDDIRNAGDVDCVLLVAGLTTIGEPFTTFMEGMDM